MISALERVALTVLAGALWVVGYLVAPMLYRTLDDPALAAGLAGELTGMVAWVCLGCAAVLVPAQLRHPIRPLAAHWRLWLLVLLTVLIVLGELVVRPPMALLPEQADEVGYLAGLRAAESLYLVASAIALVMVLGGIHPRGGQASTAESFRQAPHASTLER
ncbi:MAG: DUF4149 domain-containing protein [Halorhodospira sp.]